MHQKGLVPEHGKETIEELEQQLIPPEITPWEYSLIFLDFP